jgi:hypothetical protein
MATRRATGRGRPRRRRAPPPASAESAARGLWKDLEDERRRDLVRSLRVEDGVLVVTYAKDPVTLPAKWEGHHVRQEIYRRPASELELKTKGAVVGLLGIAEKDPERVMRLFEGAVDTTKNLAQFVQSNPGEVKKFLLNNVLAGVAKGVKKKLEKG